MRACARKCVYRAVSNVPDSLVGTYLTRSSCNRRYLADCKMYWQVTAGYDDLREQYLYYDARLIVQHDFSQMCNDVSN